MTEENNQYASKGIAGTGLGLGIAGTALGLLAGHGGFGGFGIGGNGVAQAANSAVMLDIAKKDAEIAQLKADAATDKKLVDVYTELRKQDKAQDAVIANINTRLTAVETAAPLREQIVLGQVQNVATALSSVQATIASITKCVVPNSSVCPGWGNVTITPATAG